MAPEQDPPLTLEFLARTRPLSVTATALLGLQVAGNLYEEIVTNPQAVAHPRPGALPGELETGSPVFFYMPWVAIGAGAAVLLRARHGAAAPRHVRRAWNAALVCLGVVATTKTALITRVNPLFRDPDQNPEHLRHQAQIWGVANAMAIAAGAAALALLTAVRRLPTTVAEEAR